MHRPGMDFDCILLLVHPGMIHLEDRRKTGFDKGDTTDIERKPVIGDGDDVGFKRLDLATAREDFWVHVGPIGEVPDGFWGGGWCESVGCHC